MLDTLKEMLTQETAADGLPRNRAEYRILEIDLTKGLEHCRPKGFGYAFWGPWCSCAEPVMKCKTKDDVLRFFSSYEIVGIDDSMAKGHFPEVDFGGEEDGYHTITDTITIDVAEGRCFVIRDWDRSKRAHRLFAVHAKHEDRDEDATPLRSQEAPYCIEEESIFSSWRFKEYMVI